VYLVWEKRLFGVRGGGKAERAVHEWDTGWGAIERATPQPRRTPSASTAAAAGTTPAGAPPGSTPPAAAPQATATAPPPTATP